MNDTTYAVAFRDGHFLMVWNPKRRGWEMPGGHVEPGEDTAQATIREFAEECGFEIRLIAQRNLGHCDVYAAILGDYMGTPGEMEFRLFDSLPAELSFDRSEYEDTVPWAREQIWKPNS